MSESEYQPPERYSVYVDFDGVINSYVSGWVGPDVIPDPPIDGAIAFLNEVAAEYELVIFTTRARYPEAHDAIRAYLSEYGFGGECTISAEKGPGIFYLDDRAWRFRGVFPSLRTIRYAKPWRVGDSVRPTLNDALRSKGADIQTLEGKLGRRKAELRQLKDAAEAVVDYYTVDDQPLPDVLANLQAFLKSSRTTPEGSRS